MNTFSLALLLTGVALSVIGWLFDRITNLPLLLKMISPDYLYGTEALRLLAANDRRHLLSTHRGFQVLLNRWPHSYSDQAASIGRSVAFTEFGAQITNDFELRLCDATQADIAQRWSLTLAQKQLDAELEKRTFWLGTVVFFVGIVITLASGLIDLIGGVVTK